MKKRVIVQLSLLALITGCLQEKAISEDPLSSVCVTLESIVSDTTAETRTYADERHLVVWHNDDRVSVFEKKEYWEEYKYIGRTGTAGGRILPVTSEGSGTGGDMDYYYAVYPHSELNGFDNNGHLLLNLPNEQPYDEFSFGRGTNLMVSASDDNNFRFKNIGGYLVFKLYGQGISVSSIRLVGNNGEELTGDIDVVVSPDADPVTKMSTARYAEKYSDAKLVCDSPVALGATSTDYKEFWFVLPPMTFTKGFSIEVNTSDGGVWTKTTAKPWTITRNHYSPVSVMEVAIESPQPDNVVYYTSTDGSLVYANEEKIDATIVSNDYVDGVGVLTFNSPLTTLGRSAFVSSTLKTISLPPSVISVAPRAFDDCNNLQKFEGKYGEDRCLVIANELVSFAPGGITEYKTPDGISSIGEYAFYGCSGLTTLIVSEGVETIGERACEFSGLVNLVLPETLREVGNRFLSGTNVSSLSLPSKVQNISDINHLERLNAIEINNPIPASISANAFGTDHTYPIYIPAGTLSLYSSAWPDYANRLREKSSSPLNIINYTTTDGSKVSLESGFGSYMLPIWEQNESILSHTYGEMVFYAPVTEIPHDTFLRSKLKSITLPSSVTVLGGNCFEESDLESIVLSDWIEEISSCSFYECHNLNTINLPEGLISIGYQSFYDCTSLSTITIPKSVKKIGKYAFQACSGLISVTVNAIIPPAGGEGMFIGTNDCPIYVPEDSVNDYKQAEYWSDYADRIQAIPSSSIPVPEAVDLGLPSGIKWASFNLGASAPEEFGDYYAWGETEPYFSRNPMTWKEGKEEGYTWTSYKWCMGSNTTMTKYCTNSSYGYNGFTDDKTVLDPEDDAAHVNLGGKWRMPTVADWAELFENCTCTWDTRNGWCFGITMSSKTNNNSIYLPASGYCSTSSTPPPASGYRIGYYRTSTLDVDNPYRSWIKRFDSDKVSEASHNRYLGYSIRPVYDEQ